MAKRIKSATPPGAVASVRFIPTDHNAKHGWSGNKPALVIPGEEVLHCVVYDELEIGVRELPLALLDKCNHVIAPGAIGTPYPVARYIERVRSSKKPINPTAERLLQIAEGMAALTEFPRSEVDTAVSEAAAPAPRKRDREPKPAREPAAPSLIGALAAEFGMDPPKMRKALRAAGLRAPYTDEAAIRKALGGPAASKKGK